MGLWVLRRKILVEEIDINKVRNDFPVLDKVAFLASAAVAPMPRCTIDAVEEAIQRAYVEYDPGYWTDENHFHRLERCRAAAATLINANSAFRNF